MHNSQEGVGVSWEHYSRIAGSLGLLGTSRRVLGASTVDSENGFYPIDCFSSPTPYCQGTSAKIYLADLNYECHCLGY
jgi:hypothetical protein